MTRIGIVGGGPAGIALAYRLSGWGHDVTLFEGASEFGGLARALPLGDLRVDRYYHFICANDLEYLRWIDELALGSDLRWATTRTGLQYNGSVYPLSTPADLLFRCRALTFPGRVRYGALAFRCAMTTDWHRLDGIPAKDWLIHNLGFDTYHVMWHPLLKVKFHEYHDTISAAWVWHRIHRVASSRGPVFQRERFGYLRGGTSTFLDALVRQARARGAKLLTSEAVCEIVHDGHRCTGVRTSDGSIHSFDVVISTVPLPVFLAVTRTLPERYAERLRSIRFIGVVCVALRLRHRLTENFWLNVHDPRVPFNGCIEYGNLDAGLVGDGSSVLYVPYYVPVDDPRFTCSRQKTLEDTVHALSSIRGDFSENWVLQAEVSSDPHAQVICSTGFRLLLPTHETPIRGLLLLESSQLYPADRSISATLELVSRVAARVGAEGAA